MRPKMSYCNRLVLWTKALATIVHGMLFKSLNMDIIRHLKIFPSESLGVTPSRIMVVKIRQGIQLEVHFGKSPRFPLASNIHHGSSGHRRGPRPPISERQPIILSPETTVEMFDFPIAFRTNDLKNSLNKFAGRYRFKWHNDTSCWVVFNSSEDVEEALSTVDEYIKFRRYDPANDTTTASSVQPDLDHDQGTDN